MTQPARKQHENRTTNPHANLEPNPCYAPDGTEKPATFNSPVRLRFTHYRKRLCDPDGLSVKAVIDALVAGKVLTDDSTKQVAEITHRQVKSADEKTIIEIEEVEPCQK